MNRFSKLYIAYEVVMFSLVVVSVIFLWFEEPFGKQVDLAIWFIFVMDYLIRLGYSKERRKFIKTNLFDLIVIIPLDSIFMTARFAHAFRIFRLLYIGKRHMPGIVAVLKTNGLHKALSVTFILIFLLSIPIYLIEPSIQSYEDAIWWAIVTTSTVGYGDLSPETGIGRAIAVVLMIFGIGLIGVLTGSIANFFFTHKPKQKDMELAFIQTQLERFEELSNEEVNNLVQLIISKHNQKHPFSDTKKALSHF